MIESKRIKIRGKTFTDERYNSETLWTSTDQKVTRYALDITEAKFLKIRFRNPIVIISPNSRHTFSRRILKITWQATKTRQPDLKIQTIIKEGPK